MTRYPAINGDDVLNDYDDEDDDDFDDYFDDDDDDELDFMSRVNNYSSFAGDEEEDFCDDMPFDGVLV